MQDRSLPPQRQARRKEKKENGRRGDVGEVEEARDSPIQGGHLAMSVSGPIGRERGPRRRQRKTLMTPSGDFFFRAEVDHIVEGLFDRFGAGCYVGEARAFL